jgi:hypothetical protein
MYIKQQTNMNISVIKKYGLMAMAMMVVVHGMTSCDDHETIDTNIHVGHVLCSDGNVLTADDCKKQGKEPVAIVFYTSKDNNDNGEGLAVGLKEISAVAFSDTLGVNQGTTASTTNKDGNANTFALYSNSKAGSPLAKEVFAVWRYGQSAYIPSVAEMRLLYAAIDVVNPLMVRFGGDPIARQNNGCWYWTSTEVEGQASAKAWLYSLGTGAMQETPKTEAHPARYIITLNR